mmetsp:Transcript_72862/g.235741  ORF Transcript_72862/g.235741 Transcript_72862/m.235741 type:complete len:204 (-) Transcript_72862:1030-1641(-)
MLCGAHQRWPPPCQAPPCQAPLPPPLPEFQPPPPPPQVPPLQLPAPLPGAGERVRSRSQALPAWPPAPLQGLSSHFWPFCQPLPLPTLEASRFSRRDLGWLPLPAPGFLRFQSEPPARISLIIERASLSGNSGNSIMVKPSSSSGAAKFARISFTASTGTNFPSSRSRLSVRLARVSSSVTTVTQILLPKSWKAAAFLCRALL